MRTVFVVLELEIHNENESDQDIKRRIVNIVDAIDNGMYLDVESITLKRPTNSYDLSFIG